MTIRNIRFALTAFGVAIALAAPRNDVVAQSGGAGAVGALLSCFTSATARVPCWRSTK